MLDIVHAGIILLLLQLGMQDFRYRAVSWVLFPLLVTMAIIKYQLVFVEVRSLFQQVAWNMLFVAVQMGLLYLYFCIKNKKWVALTRDYLGWGDILFFLTSAFFFSFFNFLLFYLFSLFLVIVIAFLSDWTKPQGKNIPLAGCQALFLVAVYSLDLFSSKINLLHDEYLIKMLDASQHL